MPQFQHPSPLAQFDSPLGAQVWGVVAAVRRGGNSGGSRVRMWRKGLREIFRVGEVATCMDKGLSLYTTA